jgi:hypothetical protein
MTSSDDRAPGSASPDEASPDAGTIEVRVRELCQLFDSMDPSPFHERDLDPNAEEYIVGSAKELPSGAVPALLVHLDGSLAPGEDDRVVGDAIREHFTRKAELSRRELRELLRRGWISLIIGLSFLATAILVGTGVARWMGPGPLADVLRESLLIGGWVAMWRPLEIFLYDWWGIRGRRRVHEKLARMRVRVVPTGARAAARRF